MREKTLHALIIDYLDKNPLASLIDDVLINLDSAREFAADMRAAECFDFGDLHLEPAEAGITEDGDKLAFHAPKLTPDELGFWHEGLIPLPAPICWYEIKINAIKSGLLVKKDGERTLTQRVEYQPGTKTFAPKVIADGMWTYIELPDNATRFHSVNEKALSAMATLVGEKAAFVAMSYAVNPFLMIYLTLMINSQTTDVRKVMPDAGTNRLRRLRGKTPINGHTIVTIVPKRFIVETPNGEHKVGSHKRLHWRRSHIRVLRRDQPTEKKIVIPRFLVGRRELGEVTHEYRVRAS